MNRIVDGHTHFVAMQDGPPGNLCAVAFAFALRTAGSDWTSDQRLPRSFQVFARDLTCSESFEIARLEDATLVRILP